MRDLDETASLYVAGLSLYEEGVELPQAVEHFTQAASQGHALAAYKLAGCYANGWGVEVDQAQADRYFRQAAEGGLAEACNSLGIRYWHGKGVARNGPEAVHWFERAADKGNAQSAFNLYVIFRDGGSGVDVDSEASDHFLERAYKLDYPDATYAWALRVEDKGGDPLEIYEELAESGHGPAALRASLFYAGAGGREPNWKRCAELSRIAAERGHAQAQFNLASILFEGDGGVPQNQEEAIHWVSLAARGGYPPAQFSLGRMFLHGKGVSEAPSEARRLLTLAAEQGYAGAKELLDTMEPAPEGVPQAAGGEEVKTAALAGDFDSQYRLAMAYHTGAGVDPNAELALFWMTRAGFGSYHAAPMTQAVSYLVPPMKRMQVLMWAMTWVPGQPVPAGVGTS